MNVEASDEMISGPLDDAKGGGDEVINEGVFAVLKAPRASMR